MADKTAPIPSETPAPEAAPSVRRVVTLPVLPLVITGSILIALLFFCGGAAVGYVIGDHHPVRTGVIRPFEMPNGIQGGPGGFGQNGFGQNHQGPHDGPRPNDQPTPAPTQG
jgi:hypothetical protein